MLPRISAQSSIPHVSLSVALRNLEDSTINYTTNMFHPSTHELALNSEYIQLTSPSITATHSCSVILNSTAKKFKVECHKEVEQGIRRCINEALEGKYDEHLEGLTVNQKAIKLYNLMNDAVYYIADSYNHLE